jgi:hypothetical protein
MSATVSPRSRIRAKARAPSRRCSARRCSASSRTCACRSASHSLTALSFCSATRKAPVVRFSFQPLTVHLSLGITHLAAHIVFGLNLGHSGEPTTAWPIGANTSATFVHHEYPGVRRQRAAPPLFHADVRRPMPHVWADGADRRPPGAPWPAHRVPRPPGRRAAPSRGDLAFATTIVKSSRLPRLSTPRFLSRRISRWLHHIHTSRCHHTAPTHLRNRPSCPFRLKVARDCPDCLGFAK